MPASTRPRAPAAERTFSSAEVRRALDEAGWHIARETLAELSDALFGEEIRPGGGGKRRWRARHVEQLITIGRIRRQANLSLADVIAAVTSSEEEFADLAESIRRQAEATITDLSYLRSLVRRRP